MMDDMEIFRTTIAIDNTERPDLVVFAEDGDMVLLGAHSLEGLNLHIDSPHKRIVPAGPIVTAYACV